MKRRGYRVVYDNRATASDISGYLGQEDAYGWFFGGHGAAGILFCAKAGGPDYEDIMTASIASGALHHKLGFVTLYACQAGEESGWINLVSQYGILRAKEGNVHPAWTDWDEIPIVPHPDEE